MAKKTVPAKAKGKAGRPATSRNTLDALGIEAICERIEAGESQAEIAKAVKVGVARLSEWLDSQPNSERFARARLSSAEGWLDRGMTALKSAKSTNPEIARARAIAQECARRAALRNPAYRENRGLELTGGLKILRMTDADAGLL